MARAGAYRISAVASPLVDSESASLFTKEGALAAAGPFDTRLTDILPSDVRLIDVLPAETTVDGVSLDTKLIDLLPRDLKIIDVVEKDPTLSEVFPQTVRFAGSMPKLLDVLPPLVQQPRREDVVDQRDPLAFPSFRFER